MNMVPGKLGIIGLSECDVFLLLQDWPIRLFDGCPFSGQLKND